MTSGMKAIKAIPCVSAEITTFTFTTMSRAGRNLRNFPVDAPLTGTVRLSGSLNYDSREERIPDGGDSWMLTRGAAPGRLINQEAGTPRGRAPLTRPR